MRLTSTNAGFALKFPYFAVRLSCARQVSAGLACTGQDGAVLLTEEGGSECGPLSSPKHSGLRNVDK